MIVDPIVRFLGQRDLQLLVARRPGDPAGDAPLTALQLLLPGPLALDAPEMARALRAFSPQLGAALPQCELTASEGTALALVRWGLHAVQIVGIDVPMPADVVETGVAPAHYGQDLKRRARAHKAHALLYHVGEEPSPRDRYAALAAVAAALAPPGSFILNEAAHTSLPVDVLGAMTAGGDRYAQLRSLPLLLLYAGFVKHEVEGIPGVWMRTYGNHLLRLPDLAAHADGHDLGQVVFDMFDSIMNYLLDSGASLGPGHTMQVGPDAFLRFRAPNKSESFLTGEGGLVVAESIAAREVNA
jgi:hypothetical protein